MAKHWYSYNGPCPIFDAVEPYAASNYVYTTIYGTAIGLACPGGSCPCAIYATGPAGPLAHPTSPLSGDLKQAITDALFTESCQRLPKCTVYVKSF